jgi:hypothetical protein
MSVSISESASTVNLPITNDKRHGISNNNDSGHCISAQLMVAVDEIVDTYSDADRVGKGKRAHGYHEPKPVDMVGSFYTPENMRSWDNNYTSSKGLKTSFGFHDSFVTTGKMESQSVNQCPAHNGCCDDTNETRYIAQADHSCAVEILSVG